MYGLSVTCMLFLSFLWCNKKKKSENDIIYTPGQSCSIFSSSRRKIPFLKIYINYA